MLDPKQGAAEQTAPPSASDEDASDAQDGDARPRDADGVPQSIANDDAFHLLQNSRRRAVLRYILAHPDQQEFRMRDLAEAVAAWEHDTTLQQLNSTQRQRVYIALYQSHLPKLDNHDVIDYNQPRGIVEPTRLIAALAPFLEEGLDADTRRLSVEDTGPFGSDGNTPHAGLVPALSSLFPR